MPKSSQPKSSPSKSARSKSSRKLADRKDAAPEAAGGGSDRARKKATVGGKARRPAQKTFLVAATMPHDAATPHLRVFAAVKRSPAEALAAVKESLGAEISVELTGKLSNRMAKTLGLKLDEIRQI